jgi:hypothetical protein
MNKIFFGLLLLTLVSILFSCQDKDETPISITEERDFYPLQKGIYNVYHVKEINYNIITGNLTKEYYLKELVTDSLLDGSGDYSYVINRYTKNTMPDSWKLDSVWTARYQSGQVIKVENNVPFVKLVFPFREGKKWNGNAFNTRGEETYQMDSLYFSKSYNNMSFDSTLVQTQKQDSSSISQDYRKEIYAKGFGLIYKKSIITANSQKDGSLQFPIKIASGIDYTQTIISYGKE